jgi:hypothetical protein
MSASSDAEFSRLMQNNGFVPNTTRLAFDQGIIVGDTATGERFRQFMWDHAAEVAGIPDWVGFNGEFGPEVDDRMTDAVTEHLMQELNTGLSPIRYGGLLALTGTGVITTSSWGVRGYKPTLIDEEISLFGTVRGVGVTEYEAADPDKLAASPAEALQDLDPTKGVVAVLRDIEVRDTDYGNPRDVLLLQAIVPLAAESLQLHHVGQRSGHA